MPGLAAPASTHDQRRSHYHLFENWEADRAFFRDVLAFPNVDAGHGWPIFAMPPLEAAFHGAEDSDWHELYLRCDDIASTLDDLRSRKVPVTPVTEQRWGKVAAGRREGRHV